MDDGATKDTTAARFMRDNLVWDNHGCMPQRPLDESFLPQLSRYRDAGVDVAILNIGYGEQSIELHLRMIAQFRRWISMRPEHYTLIRNAADIERDRKSVV